MYELLLFAIIISQQSVTQHHVSKPYKQSMFLSKNGFQNDVYVIYSTPKSKPISCY